MIFIEWCFPFWKIYKNNGVLGDYCVKLLYKTKNFYISVIFTDFWKRKAPFNRTHQDAYILFYAQTF